MSNNTPPVFSGQPLIIASGSFPSGWYGSPQPRKVIDVEKVGNDMIVNIDRLKTKEVGEIVMKISEKLDLLSQESLSRHGWNNYEDLVKLFEELTAYDSKEPPLSDL